MKDNMKKEIEQLIEKLNLNCTIEEFKDYVDWARISHSIILSEDFMREFHDRVDWQHISHSQELSEDFIREFKEKVYWGWISYRQELSDEFREEFKDKMNYTEEYSEEVVIEDKYKVKNRFQLMDL